MQMTCLTTNQKVGSSSLFRRTKPHGNVRLLFFTGPPRPEKGPGSAGGRQKGGGNAAPAAEPRWGRIPPAI